MGCAPYRGLSTGQKADGADNARQNGSIGTGRPKTGAPRARSTNGAPVVLLPAPGRCPSLGIRPRLPWDRASSVFGVVGQDVVTIEVRQLDAGLPLPDYAHMGDAGADLRARTDVTIAPGGGRALVPTGVALAIPAGYAGFVQPRSGLALRHGVTVLNAPGLIDAGYRDELRVLLVNTDPVTPYEVHRGDRVAQLVIKSVAQAEFVPVEELPGSTRGTGGFGHSGR
jgi:dUTP pyrophosphatase